MLGAAARRQIAQRRIRRMDAVTKDAAQSPDIFSLNGKLVWLKNGQLLTVSATILAEIIATRVVTVHLTNRGTPD